MEIFATDPLVQVVGIAEVNPRADGVALARRLNIPITRDYRELLAMERVDLIIDVSGSAEVGRVLQDFHRMGVAVIGGASAKFMWQLIEARIRATAEIEKTLNKYQSLYRLYVKESGAAVTEERTRIACEIHDGLVQNLAGVNFKLDLCQELLRKDPRAAQTTLRETKAQLKMAIQEARQVIFNLRPVQYDKMDLIPALANYLRSYETQYHIKTEFSVSGDETTLLPKTKIFLFRIVQEALSNVQKHAKTMCRCGSSWAARRSARRSPTPASVSTWMRCRWIRRSGTISASAGSSSGRGWSAEPPVLHPKKARGRALRSSCRRRRRRPSRMERIKVLISDDHRVVREGLSAILKTKENIEVVGEAQDGQEAVEKARSLVPDVILMDVSMPRMGGVEATRIIKREFPHIGIIALTMYEEQQYIFDLVRAGATGYLLKDTDSSQIVAAIRAVYRGESLIHPSVASKILAEFSLLAQRKGKKPGWVEHDLTEREITVLRLVADGKTNKEIANNLDLSEKTVKNHVRNIFHKLQVYDRTQAAILAIRKGLIELEPRP
jgi:DNA-binding NarL/FixJ family response regulator/two-component sensor histidine kinase